jgi:integrase/recombinase XerD
MTPLRRRMIDDMQIRNLAPLTQTAYVQQVSLFARHFGRSPEYLGREEIRAWQIHLVQDKHLAASSISVAVAALRFLYTVTLKRDWPVEEDIPTVRRPQKLPVVLSQEEVGQFLDAVRGLKHRVILTVCYAAELRVSEAIRLRPAAHGPARGGGQRSEGSLCDALTAAVGVSAGLLQDGASDGVAVPGRAPRAANLEVRG